jgi:hypothetical protein
MEHDKIRGWGLTAHIALLFLLFALFVILFIFAMGAPLVG